LSLLEFLFFWPNLEASGGAAQKAFSGCLRGTISDRRPIARFLLTQSDRKNALQPAPVLARMVGHPGPPSLAQSW